MNINETYEKLSKEEKEHLNYAFETKISQMVKLPDKRFIGVYLVASARIVIDEEQNHWSIGHIEE